MRLRWRRRLDTERDDASRKRAARSRRNGPDGAKGVAMYRPRMLRKGASPMPGAELGRRERLVSRGVCLLSPVVPRDLSAVDGATQPMLEIGTPPPALQAASLMRICIRTPVSHPRRLDRPGKVVFSLHPNPLPCLCVSHTTLRLLPAKARSVKTLAVRGMEWIDDVIGVLRVVNPKSGTYRLARLANPAGRAHPPGLPPSKPRFGDRVLSGSSR